MNIVDVSKNRVLREATSGLIHHVRIGTPRSVACDERVSHLVELQEIPSTMTTPPPAVTCFQCLLVGR